MNSEKYIGLQGRNIRRGLPNHRFAIVLRALCLHHESLLCVRGDVLVSTSVRAVFALPQGPSLRSGLCCPSPSSLNRPHPPHSWAHPDFAALRLIPDALAVRFPPRRPLSGSVLSLCLPSPHAALYDRGKFISCTRSVPSPMTLAFAKSLTARHSRNPHHPFPMGGMVSRLHWFAGSLRPCRVARTPVRI